MTRVLIAMPERDVDPTEVAVPWRVLRDRGVEVRFATPTGQEGQADELMLSGAGLDPWAVVPWSAVRQVRVIGRLLRADRRGREAYQRLMRDPYFQAPLAYTELRVEDFDGLVLPGGHRARGMREYLESPTLQRFVGAFFDTGKPLGAICHGVVLAARSRSPRTGRSILFGRKTTALPWRMERAAWILTRCLARFWDPNYYRTYVEAPGEPAGARSVQSEVTQALAQAQDFIDVAPNDAHRWRKSSGLFRDRKDDARCAHVVCDGTYVSARWPGDAHTFAARFAELLPPFVLAPDDSHVAAQREIAPWLDQAG